MKKHIKELYQSCNDRIKQWEKSFGMIIKARGNIYISTLESISRYLDAYLNKDINDSLMVLIDDGYQQYDSISTSDYIPTIESCKSDTLHEADLDIIDKIINLSMFLSNRDFTHEANKVLFNHYASVQYEYDHNQFDENHFNSYPSNGFQYYLAGKICEFDKRWEDSFDNYRTPRNVNLAIPLLNVPVISASLLCLLGNYHLTGLALAIVSGAIYKTSDLIADNVSITLFSNNGKKRVEEIDPNIHINEKCEKQHLTPHHIVSVWSYK